MDCLPQIHVAAIHSEAEYHTYVPGIGVLCEEGVYVFGVGQYKNSEKDVLNFRKTSNYVMFGAHPLKVYNWKIGATGLLLNGYSYKNGEWFLGAGLIASHPIPIGNVHFLYIPKIKNITPHVLQISFTIDW